MSVSFSRSLLWFTQAGLARKACEIVAKNEWKVCAVGGQIVTVKDREERTYNYAYNIYRVAVTTFGFPGFGFMNMTMARDTAYGEQRMSSPIAMTVYRFDGISRASVLGSIDVTKVVDLLAYLTLGTSQGKAIEWADRLRLQARELA